jgi:hypothetical protein
MAFRPFLPLTSELPSTPGLALATGCQAASRSIVAATAHEMRETLAGVALIVRFAGFVAAILARHHLRRLWPGAAGRKNWLGAHRAAPSGRAAASVGRL